MSTHDQILSGPNGPFVDEVSFNAVTSQGPAAAYVGKLLTPVGRHDEAEGRLLEALTMTESFGREYHRTFTLVALAQNRVTATGNLDVVAEQWLTRAEELCATYGLGSWARRAGALRGVSGLPRGRRAAGATKPAPCLIGRARASGRNA